MRNLIVALLILGGTSAGSAIAADRYISPWGQGSKDGSSIGNAAALSAINAQISKAGPGGRVLMLTDKGTYTGKYISIYTGGASGKPVTITGIKSNGSAARVSVGGGGDRYFNLGSGASNLTFSDFNFYDIGQGCFYISGAVTNLTIRNTDATKVRKLLDMADTASLNGFWFQNLTSSKFSKAFIQLKNASNGTIVDINIDSNWTDGDPLPFGVHGDGKSKNVTIRNMSVKHLMDSAGGNIYKYWNGDGVATERETEGFKMDNIRVDGVPDAGFDLKGGTTSNPHVVTNSSVTNSKRGLRVWGVTQANNLRIGTLRFPSKTLNGKTITQSPSSGPLAAVWMKEGSNLKYKNITVNGVTIYQDKFDRWDGPSTVGPLP